MQFLLGDFDWAPELTAKTQKPLIESLLNDENTLLHGYRQALAGRPGLVRTPTREINQSFLTPYKLESRVEAACNIAVNGARQAVQVLGLDTVICGVVGPLAGPTPWDRAEISKFLGETAIFLIDKEIDCLQLEGVSDLKAFQQVLEMIKMVNLGPVPMSAFFDLKQEMTDQLWVDLLTIANGLELELVGLELTLEQALAMPKRPDWGVGAGVGFMIKAGGKSLTLEEEGQALEKMLSMDPSLMLGGTGVNETQWRHLNQAMEGLLTR